jgi:hypothetical protein
MCHVIREKRDEELSCTGVVENQHPHGSMHLSLFGRLYQDQDGLDTARDGAFWKTIAREWQLSQLPPRNFRARGITGPSRDAGHFLRSPKRHGTRRGRVQPAGGYFVNGSAGQWAQACRARSLHWLAVSHMLALLSPTFGLNRSTGIP